MDEQGRSHAAAQWIKGHLGKGLLIVAVLAALYVFWSVAGCAGCDGAPGLGVAVAVVALAVAGHFVHAFTRNLPPAEKTLRSELRTIFIYGYVIQILALVTGLLLLIGVFRQVPEGELGGLVYGCQASDSGYGSDLASCSDEEPARQWLLHIGSRREGPFEAKAEKDLLNAVDVACDLEVPEDVEAEGGDTVARGSGENSEAAANAETARRPAIRAAIERLGLPVGAGTVSAVAMACEGRDAERRSRIEEALLANGVVSKQYELRGGLIVPLYAVVLSMMGAAVGMSRRLPEIQRQAAHSVQSTGKGISPIVARERVVFQIMQLFAAPLIAVTAFAALGPDTVTAAVLIGFTSGFASEVVLMKLRQASEALSRSGRSNA